ncbi:hypothetical protein M2337_000245 [Sphingobium sp. B2D3A]|nr:MULTISPECIES: hypothetical protein [unclassified Sphingobium]MCW2336012.1 hypothetical protein [Sphingobium sp. B2D3A]MCW2385771.1 hypothetical protein [Sphingobium sp. B2D3D]MCW2404462.1 hypothetical protein [Sphingobium sp. B1D7B]
MSVSRPDERLLLIGDALLCPCSERKRAAALAQIGEAAALD